MLPEVMKDRKEEEEKERRKQPSKRVNINKFLRGVPSSTGYYFQRQLPIFAKAFFMYCIRKINLELLAGFTLHSPQLPPRWPSG